MKLSSHSKAIGIIGLGWLVFLGVAEIANFHTHGFYLLLFGICSALLMIWLVRFSITKRVETLYQRLADINAENMITKRIELKGQDELSQMAAHINLLLDSVKAAQENIEYQSEILTQELQEKNSQLAQARVDHADAETTTNPENTYLSHLAHYDQVTTLPNRIFFNEILNKAISHAKRREQILAVLIIDINSFSQIHAKYGAAISEMVLKEISNRFTSVLRAEDIIAKLEGDEFIILLNDIHKSKFASAVAEKLLHACTTPIKLNSYELTPTISIGICVYPNDGDSLESLLKNADSALHKAKSAGGNVYQFFTPEMDKEAHEYMKLGTDLRRAISNNELVLYYQPKLHIKKGIITGVEALIRWIHPELGMINPSQFIPLAEETGLIMSIGEWAIREACQTNKSWQDEGYGHMTIAVNLSPLQFNHPDITHVINRALEDSGLNPQYLELEITETTIMSHIELSAYKLDSLKALGVQISIDHFGVGYTSISGLKNFPISVLKIDPSFIKGIPHNPNDAAITNTFISLAHHLGMEVIAEGVETAEQVQYLAAQHCDMVQGYFLSYPVPAQKIVLQFTQLRDGVLI